MAAVAMVSSTLPFLPEALAKNPEGHVKDQEVTPSGFLQSWQCWQQHPNSNGDYGWIPAPHYAEYGHHTAHGDAGEQPGPYSSSVPPQYYACSDSGAQSHRTDVCSSVGAQSESHDTYPQGVEYVPVEGRVAKLIYDLGQANTYAYQQYEDVKRRLDEMTHTTYRVGQFKEFFQVERDQLQEERGGLLMVNNNLGMFISNLIEENRVKITTLGQTVRLLIQKHQDDLRSLIQKHQDELKEKNRLIKVEEMIRCNRKKVIFETIQKLENKCKELQNDDKAKKNAVLQELLANNRILLENSNKEVCRLRNETEEQKQEIKRLNDKISQLNSDDSTLRGSISSIIAAYQARE